MVKAFALPAAWVMWICSIQSKGDLSKGLKGNLGRFLIEPVNLTRTKLFHAYLCVLLKPSCPRATIVAETKSIVTGCRPNNTNRILKFSVTIV
jgi:hypothetical protein